MNLNYNNLVIMIAVKKRFRKYLKSQGLRYTPEREAILETIFSTSDHIEADDLVFALRQKNKRISHATVYRTLEHLVKCGLVTKVTFGENHTHYEHTFGHIHHDHLVCLNCGTVSEFNSPSLEKLQEDICQQQNFKADHHSLQIFGLCKHCQEKAKK